MTEMNRRAFAESVLTAALVPMLGVAVPVLPTGWWGSATGVTDLDGLADALAGVVRAQYAERLTAEDFVTVTRQIRTALGRAEEMRKVDLANGDEPDFVFAAPPPAGTP